MLIVADVGGNILLININIALSGDNLILCLIIDINCPTVTSPGTRYFFLSISFKLHPFALPTITGILSGNLSLTLLLSIRMIGRNKGPRDHD